MGFDPVDAKKGGEPDLNIPQSMMFEAQFDEPPDIPPVSVQAQNAPHKISAGEIRAESDVSDEPEMPGRPALKDPPFSFMQELTPVLIDCFQIYHLRSKNLCQWNRVRRLQGQKGSKNDREMEPIAKQHSCHTHGAVAERESYCEKICYWIHRIIHCNFPGSRYVQPNAG